MREGLGYEAGKKINEIDKWYINHGCGNKKVMQHMYITVISSLRKKGLSTGAIAKRLFVPEALIRYYLAKVKNKKGD